jgi:hypothetical protein
MPQDTTVTLYLNGETITVSAAVDSIEGAVANAIHYHEVLNARPGIDNNSNQDYPFLPFLVIALTVLLIYLLNTYVQPKVQQLFGRLLEEPAALPPATAPAAGALVYHGDELDFSDEELQAVLNKYFVYYTRLNATDQLKFLHRLKKFIRRKVFVIHDKSGFKEMPILISAAAIQISFGLDKYLLPFFSRIQIFPEAFIGVYPTLRLLEGNVSGHSINLSWKHFLDGYKFPENGQNVGLHEFAHAFHWQYFEAGRNVERDFVSSYPLFDEHGAKAYRQEQTAGNDLYSDYALTHFQEFWAESVEVFFEKPAAMKAKYPELYQAMCELLNQNPLTHISNFT